MVEKIGGVGGALGWTVFKVGDPVSRDGTDIQRVVDVQSGGQMITVECVKEPLGALEGDGGTRTEPWCRVGERETNLARRYELLGEVVEGVSDNGEIVKPG